MPRPSAATFASELQAWFQGTDAADIFDPFTYLDGEGEYWVIGTGDYEALNAGWTREISAHVMWQRAAV